MRRVLEELSGEELFGEELKRKLAEARKEARKETRNKILHSIQTLKDGCSREDLIAYMNTWLAQLEKKEEYEGVHV